MRLLKLSLAAAALAAVVGTPAYAAPKGKAAPPAAKSGHGPSMPDMAQMQAFFDKLFPPQPDPDPARLALARTSANALWPEGNYAQVMTGLMGTIFDHAMSLKPADLGAMGDKVRVGGTSAPNLSLHDQAAATDPYFDQRVAAIRQAVSEEMGKISVVIDPRIREGLARSMARRFDAAQLADINRFYATPSGHALASQTMQMWMDPEMFRAMFSSFPEMMKLAPGMMEKLKAANDRFPSPPKTVSKPAKH